MFLSVYMSHTQALAYLPDTDEERQQVSASAKLTLGKPVVAAETKPCDRQDGHQGDRCR